MPNPRERHSRLDLPLDEVVGYATHVVITCRPEAAAYCGHRAIWMTSELYAKLPHCRTYREFTQKLKCSRCGRKGWLEITAAGR